MQGCRSHHFLKNVAGAPALLCMAALSLAACAPANPNGASCNTGAYTNGAETVVLYTRHGEADKLRYTFVDGRRGVIGDAASYLDCSSGRLSSQTQGAYESMRFHEQDTRFSNDGLEFVGRLITPADKTAGIRALVIFVHGSESTPTVGQSPYPYLLAAQGVSVFAYDKRGTGQSAGAYTQNFAVLGRDAAAAAREAKRMASGQYDRIGFFGGSQGGWVAPLAARSVGADFLVVGFGLVISPLEEDAEQVYDEMRRAGYSEDEIDKARDVTDATGVIIASHFTDGFDALKQVKSKYESEPWFGTIEGEFTGSVLRASDAELRAGKAGDFEDSDVAWRHDAAVVLRALEMSQLWVIAANDTAAPGDVTRERLRLLQKDGLPITTALYPNTDHGMVEFIEAPDGSRQYTQFTEGYFRLIADFMLDVEDPPYGAATIVHAGE